MEYKPQPLVKSKLKLPDGLDGLLERMAARIHDVWAEQRLREGWRYGPARDDLQKEHPCLVPYDRLPEEEKEYDRSTALSTLQSILSLGYTIAPPQARGEAAGPGGRPPLELCRERAKQLRRAGEALQAYDEIVKGLRLWPEDIRLRQLLGLVLADIGITERANEVMQALVNEGQRDEETLSILARTYKDLWPQSTAAGDRDHNLRQAYGWYKECFDLTGGYYPGINAATLAKLVGEDETARTVAAKVRSQCRAKLETGADPGEEYYLAATLGEAALNLGRPEEAADWYRRAGRAGRGLYRDLHATRRNARLLLEHAGLDGSEIEKALFIPPVAVFTGHNLDRPGRSAARFPAGSPTLAEAVYAALRESLAAHQVGFGFSSAAAGSDLLFLKALRDLGLEAYVVLPYNKERFLADNVAYAPGEYWLNLFHSVMDDLEQKDRVAYASEWPVGEGPDIYEYANQVLFGLARLKARQLDTGLVPMVVWDGHPGDGPGGTAAAVEYWYGRGFSVQRIELDALRRDTASAPLEPEAGPVPRAITPVRVEPSCTFPVLTKAILFADVVGYSKMPEDLVPLFVNEFMGGVARLAAWSEHPPEFKNTWGDALYFVFDRVRDAGVYALDLIDFVAGTPWADKGLPDGLNLRIALHAGPVHSCVDPVMDRATFTGTHVSRAARIEPVTPPGHVFASQSFAAVAAAERVEEFTCDYVGRIELAKGYGVFSTYHVRRAATRTGS
ncbi:MAG: TRAFs-binding domain-containing protein [Thermodesulfobacteriota bacterium]